MTRVDFDPLAPNPLWAKALTIGVALLLWGAFLPGVKAAAPWIYSWDSAAYIEAAESIRAGRGVFQRIYEGLGTEIWTPMTWWPPGYSLLIAFTQNFGLSAKDSCLVVAAAGGALGVVVIALVGLKLLHWTVALPLTAALAISVAFQNVSVQCMSDTSYFALTAASLGCLIFWTISEKRSWRWLFAAGLFAGASWATRNTGLGLYAASAAFIAAHAFWEKPGRVLKWGGVWAAGAAICTLPLIIHNLIVLGAINAYYMPPSELTLAHNIRRAAKVTVSDLTTIDILGRVAGAYFFLLAALVVLAAGGALFFLLRRGWRMPNLGATIRDNRVLLLLLVFSACYAAIVIAGRTRYRWGQEIDSRHMLQIYWPLLLSLALWGTGLLRKLPLSAARTGAGLTLAFGLLGVMQARSTSAYVMGSAERIESMERRIGAGPCDYIRTHVRDDQIVLSSRAEFLRIHCGANARKIPYSEQYYKVPPISHEELYAAARSGLLWGIVIADFDPKRTDGMQPMFREFAENPDAQPGFARIFPEAPSVILEWRGERPQ